MIRGCTDKNVNATGLPTHLLFDHYQFKDLFEKFIGKRNRSGDGKKLNGSKPLQSNSPVRLTSKQTE